MRSQAGGGAGAPGIDHDNRNPLFLSLPNPVFRLTSEPSVGNIGSPKDYQIGELEGTGIQAGLAGSENKGGHIHFRCRAVVSERLRTAAEKAQEALGKSMGIMQGPPA